MSKNAKNKIHAAVPGVLKKNVALNAANNEVSELSTVHNLEILQERSPSVSPIPTHSDSPIVAGTLSLGQTTTQALGGGAMQQHFPVGMGLGFSAEELAKQQGKRKSRRSRSRKTHRRSRRAHRH